MHVAKSAEFGPFGLSCYVSRLCTAKLRQREPLFRHLIAQRMVETLSALKAPARGALTLVKAKPQQKGIQLCRQAKSHWFWGFVQAWRPAAVQPGNRLHLAPERGLSAQFCLTATHLPVPRLAWPQILFTATKNRATASQRSGYAWLIGQPFSATTNTSHSPHPAFRRDAVNCVTTSRRQRTAHV